MPAWIRFAADNLGEGEKILYQTRKHWIVVVGPALTSLICMVALLTIPVTPWETVKASPLEEITNNPWQLLILAVMPLSIASGFSLIAQVINVITTEITITNQRVIWKTGLFWRQTGEIARRVIEGSNVDQGILGRILNFGTVFVNGIGTQRLALKTIIKPLHFRHELNALTRSGNPAPESTETRPKTTQPQRQRV